MTDSSHPNPSPGWSRLFARLRQRLGGRRPSRAPARKSPRCRLQLERLEDRAVPATLTVTTTADAGAGSLRAAVLQANDEIARPGPDTINFAASLAGTTITLSTAG